MPQKVVAVFDDPGDSAMQGNLQRLRAPGATHGHTVLAYKSIDDLLNQLRNLVLNRDCIEVLEISAHGSGLITLQNVQNFGEQLNLLNKFCKNCRIYLTGCLTGVSYPPPPKGTMFPIPKMLAMSTRCTVYGAKGYLAGTHAERNTTSSRDCHYHGKYYAPVPGGQTERQLTGDDCYREFTPY